MKKIMKTLVGLIFATLLTIVATVNVSAQENEEIQYFRSECGKVYTYIPETGETLKFSEYSGDISTELVLTIDEVERWYNNISLSSLQKMREKIANMTAQYDIGTVIRRTKVFWAIPLNFIVSGDGKKWSWRGYISSLRSMSR